MINLNDVVTRARSFLRTTAGMWLIGDLEQVSLEGDKWSVSFREPFSGVPGRVYIVEVDKNSGEILGYRKEPLVST